MLGFINPLNSEVILNHVWRFSSYAQ